MNRKRILLVVLLLLVVGAVYYFYGGHSTPKGQPPLLSFSSGDLTPRKTAFNASASSIRIVVISGGKTTNNAVCERMRK